MTMAYILFLSLSFCAGNAKQTEQLQLMAEAVRRLPPAHYNCLKYMLEHLKR